MSSGLVLRVGVRLVAFVHGTPLLAYNGASHSQLLYIHGEMIEFKISTLHVPISVGQTPSLGEELVP